MDTLLLKVAVVDGMIFPKATQHMNMGGRHVSDHLLELLQRRGYPMSHPADLVAVRGLKENCCFVSQDVKVELKVGEYFLHFH